MHKETIEYQDDETTLLGYLAYDENNREKLPAVIIAHAWGGRDEFTCNKAEALAKLGYVGFALDMFGEAKLGHNNDENAQLVQPFIEDRKKLLQRISSAYAAVARHEKVDSDRIAAIGYCFGGLCVLDLARSGSDVKAVVSFHGVLTAPENVDKKPINAKALVFHGYSDPLVPPEQLEYFSKEMTKAHVDWQIHVYGNTMHSFTSPQANDPDFGTVYSRTADKRSWLATLNFLKEVL